MTILAPMAGVTDWAFRTVCREVCPGIVTVSEMVSSKGLVYNDAKTARLLRLEERSGRAGVQIFGSDPACMAEAAAVALARSGADFIDINMGCPTPKIVKNGDGCALMRDLPLAYQVIESVVKAVAVPVTVKFRRGWDRGTVNAVEFARMCEAAGAAALCVHGRTKTQMYSGAALWDEAGEIKEAVKLPVAVNGDIDSVANAQRAVRNTRADAVMVGRAAFGNPFLLRDIYNGVSKPVSITERVAFARRQFELTVEDKGERVAVLEARKFIGWYLHGLRARRELPITSMRTVQDVERILAGV
ncbi:tRNA-dihydrouridine synthase [Clostridia bacterium]|nr:tRNA-dihydrouridine synthase [Clostridia bacterium]